MKGRKLLVSLLTAVALIALTAVPAMAAEDTVSATVTVSETISFTVTDNGDAGLDFGSLTAGTDDNPEAAQNVTASAVTLTVGSETNVDCNIQTKAVDFSTNGYTIAITNAKWDIDNNVTGATTMTTGYVLVGTSTAGTPEVVDVWHWLSIPSAQEAGDYSSTFYYQAVAQ